MILFCASCTIQKRHYRNGFYVDFHSERKDHTLIEEVKQESFPQIPPDETRVFEKTNVAEEIPGDTLVTSATLTLSTSDTADVKLIPSAEEVSEVIPKDEDPPDMDHPNKRILWMMIIAIALSALGVCAVFPFITFLALAGLITPAVGLLLFIAAMLLRKRILLRVIAGEKGDDVRLSKFYPNFALTLYLLFGAVAAAYVGAAIVVFTAVGVIGIVIFQGGLIVGAAAILVLMVLGLLWLCIWRKRGEGRKKPWVPRPKDP